MTAAEDREGPRVVPASRELIAFAVAARPDWDEARTENALLAMRAAGWPWERAVMRIARAVTDPGQDPRDIVHDARPAMAAARKGGLLAEAKAALFEQAAAHAEQVRARDRGKAPPAGGGP